VKNVDVVGAIKQVADAIKEILSQSFHVINGTVVF
jgi:hypothetical protein